jgi:hypothetical protein
VKRNVVPSLMLVTFSACGINHQSETKVINGIVYDSEVSDRDGVNLGVVRIWVLKGGSYFSCTATRISEDIFLTAAHCLRGDSGNAESILIRWGYAPTFNVLSDVFSVDRWVTHPRYGGAGQYDMGLFKVKSSEVPRLAKVKIAQVSFSTPTYYSDVDIYGYGCAASGTTADGHKRYGTAFLLDPTVLGSQYRYVNLTPAQGFDPIEASVCSGDSGGPLVQGGRVVGVNTGIDNNYSYDARLDFDDVKSWYAGFRNQ